MEHILTLSPDDLQIFLVSNAVSGEIIYLDVPTPTVEAAAQALNVPTAQIIKSILFLANHQPVLAIVNGTRRIEKRAIAAEYDISHKRVRLASGEEMLILAGYEAGAMPPFGHRQSFPILIDSQVLNLPIAYAGGGAKNAMLRFTPTDILRLAQAKALPLTKNHS